MELVTTTLAVAKLWAAFELIGKTLFEAASEKTLKPFGERFGDWLGKKSGWQDKERREEFLEAYYEAENRLIKQIGAAEAYRIFRLIPRLADTSGEREELILAILEAKSGIRQEGDVREHLARWSLTEAERQGLSQFIVFLRQSLYSSTTFRPVIEFYDLEESRQAREALNAQIGKLAESYDEEVRALRVILVQSADFEQERVTYLSQIESFYEEQDFVGFPELQDKHRVPLLREVYVPLQVTYEGGGEIAIDTPAAPPGTTEPPAMADVEKKSFAFDETIFDAAPALVVLGEPGAGKSTALKKLVLDYVAQARNGPQARYAGICILVPLRDFARKRQQHGQYSLLQFLYDYAEGSLSTASSPGFFEHFLEAGGCLVCFDGLDEVAATDHRQELPDLVQAFINRYPGNRYVVTSRVVGYDRAPLSRRLFPHYHIQPLSEGDIETYIRTWYSLREKSPTEAQELAEELIGTIKQNARLSELARRPLLLALIALVHRKRVELPHERVKLYDECSEVLLTTFGVDRHLNRRDADKVYYKYRREILEAVAFWMLSEQADHAGREVIVSRAELHTFVAQLLQEESFEEVPRIEARHQADAFIKLILERTGLLVERTYDQIAFIHLTFQEYFAASYIFKNYLQDTQEMWDLVAPHLLDPGWREVILLLLGKLSGFRQIPDRIVERILAMTDEFEPILRRYLVLATDCLADNARVTVTLQKRIVDEWLRVARAPVCAAQGTQARTALERLKNRGPVRDRLREVLLDDAEPAGLRVQLAALLKSEPMPEHLFRILSAIIADDGLSPRVRAEALRALFEVPSLEDASCELVFTMLQGDAPSLHLAAVALFSAQNRGRFEAWIGAHHPARWTEVERLRLAAREPLFALMYYQNLRLFSWEPDPVPLASPPPIALHVVRVPGISLIAQVQSEESWGENLLDALTGEALERRSVRISDRSVFWQILRPGYQLLPRLWWPFTVPGTRSRPSFWMLPDEKRSESRLEFVRRVLRFVQQARDSHPSNEGAEPKADFRLFIGLFWVRLLFPEEIAVLKAAVTQPPENSLDYDVICALLRVVVHGGGLKGDELGTYWSPLLRQQESRWARGTAAWVLQSEGALDAAEARALYLDLAEGETEDWYLKQSLAYEAARLGAVSEAAAILLNVISSTHDDEEAKDAAFHALTEVSQLRVAASSE